MRVRMCSSVEPWDGGGWRMRVRVYVCVWGVYVRVGGAKGYPSAHADHW